MEDCKIYYDHTVRNATGAVVQFLYGEDGMDGTKMERQKLSYIAKSYPEMDATFFLRREDEAALKVSLTPEALAASMESEVHDRLAAHYKALLEDREFLVTRVFHGEKGETLAFPIPFERLLRTAVGRARVAGMEMLLSDLDAATILDAMDDLIARLRVAPSHAPAGFGAVRVLAILVRLYLSPKPLLMEYRLTKASFAWFISEIERFYLQAIAQPGEMVGIVSAQTIGENSTQLVLDSFHSSGTVAAVKATSGVPRFKELLGCSKHIKTPILTIYLQPDIATVIAPADGTAPRVGMRTRAEEPLAVLEPREAAEAEVEDAQGRLWIRRATVVEGGATTTERREAAEREASQSVADAKVRAMKVMRSLEVTRLTDMLESTELYWDPPGPDGLTTAVPEDAGMLEIYRTFASTEPDRCRSNSPWVLRMKLNRESLHRLGLTMMDIYVQILTAYSNTIDCVFSDDNAEELIFRIRLSKQSLKETDTEEYADTEDTIAALKAIEYNILHNVLLKGIKGIKKVSMRLKTKSKRTVLPRKRPDAWDFDAVSEWVLDTDGTNLQEILANPNVDAVRTHSNDIWEIYHTLGVEAARNALHREIMEVTGEDSMNYRHVSLLLDTMTNRGTLMSVDRHGINRGDVGPLAKCSFEETTDMLINASIFSEYDAINGVSANIMLGQLPPCGTGDCEVLLNEDEYIKLLAGRKRRAVPSAAELGRRRVVTPVPVAIATTVVGPVPTAVAAVTPIAREEMRELVAETDPCGYGAIAFQYELPEKKRRATSEMRVTFA